MGCVNARGLKSPWKQGRLLNIVADVDDANPGVPAAAIFGHQTVDRCLAVNIFVLLVFKHRKK